MHGQCVADSFVKGVCKSASVNAPLSHQGKICLLWSYFGFSLGVHEEIFSIRAFVDSPDNFIPLLLLRLCLYGFNMRFMKHTLCQWSVLELYQSSYINQHTPVNRFVWTAVSGFTLEFWFVYVFYIFYRTVTRCSDF